MKTAPNKVVTIDNQQFQLVPFYFGFNENAERIFQGYILRPLTATPSE